RVTFVEGGTELRAQTGILALDVGKQLEAGIIDHHQPGVEGSAASLALRNPNYFLRRTGPDPEAKPGDAAPQRASQSADLELVVPAEPTFDCFAAAAIALEVLEGRSLPGGAPAGSPAEGRSRALAALADYACRIDRGELLIDPANP